MLKFSSEEQMNNINILTNQIESEEAKVKELEQKFAEKGEVKND